MSSIAGEPDGGPKAGVYWMAGDARWEAPKNVAPLTTTIEADVCIVGAGRLHGHGGTGPSGRGSVHADRRRHGADHDSRDGDHNPRVGGSSPPAATTLLQVFPFHRT